MPATKFICPNGDNILIRQCLQNCPHHERCMASPTLVSIAKSCIPRSIGKFSVTELMRGTREMFLEKTTDYSVSPADRALIIQGTSLHKLAEDNSDPSIITELRLENDYLSGQIDAYGNLLGNGKKILLDYKTTSSYKAMISLGYYQVDEPTGEVYKTGLKKGQPKTHKVLKEGGIRKVLEWAIQINAYRMLMEQNGYEVEDMYIQMHVRDYNTQLAMSRNITKPIYMLKINKISNHWLEIYFEAKRQRLEEAIITGEMPAQCSSRETWKNKKCADFCNVYSECQKYEEAVKQIEEAETSKPAA